MVSSLSGYRLRVPVHLLALQVECQEADVTARADREERSAEVNGQDLRRLVGAR